VDKRHCSDPDCEACNNPSGKMFPKDAGVTENDEIALDIIQGDSHILFTLKFDLDEEMVTQEFRNAGPEGCFIRAESFLDMVRRAKLAVCSHKDVEWELPKIALGIILMRLGKDLVRNGDE
jgi:hypothetical protein